MSRTRVSDEQKRQARLRAVDKFNKESMKGYTFRFHRKNQADIIEHLESQKNKAGYIADLIKKDLIAQGKQPLVQQRVCDVVKDVDKNVVVVLLFKDNSRIIADKEVFEKDERLVEDYHFDETDGQLYIQVRYS